jgi:hypothetical protein
MNKYSKNGKVNLASLQKVLSYSIILELAKRDLAVPDNHFLKSPSPTEASLQIRSFLFLDQIVLSIDFP